MKKAKLKSIRYKGIIFDFNGVLWWDTELQERAWKEFSRQLRGIPLSQEEMSVHVHGRNNKHTMEYLVGHEISSKEAEQFTEKKESIYRKLCLQQGNKFRLSPGSVKLLDYLMKRGIPHTIATASEINNVRFFFEHFKLDKWFDFKTVVYDDGTIPGKPAPDIYLRAASKLGLDPANCVVVEDSKSGIKSSHAAGIGHIIALAPKKRRTEFLKTEGVDEVVPNLGEVLEFNIF